IVGFESGKASESRVNPTATAATSTVESVRLDAIFEGQKLDVLKIDVEGFEEAVIRGASQLLADLQRRPRVIFIEVHPYAWPRAGTSDSTLLGLLRTLGYEVFDLGGRRVTEVCTYGEIVARPLDP